MKSPLRHRRLAFSCSRCHRVLVTAVFSLQHQRRSNTASTTSTQVQYGRDLEEVRDQAVAFFNSSQSPAPRPDNVIVFDVDDTLLSTLPNTVTMLHEAFVDDDPSGFFDMFGSNLPGFLTNLQGGDFGSIVAAIGGKSLLSSCCLPWQRLAAGLVVWQ